MLRDIAAVRFHARFDGPNEDDDRLLQRMHQCIVDDGDKHRPAVYERVEREPAASGLAPQNNRQEGDFSQMKARPALNGDTRAGLLDAALRVKHGHSLRDNALPAHVRDELPQVARTVIESWPTRRQKSAAVLAATDEKEAAAERRFKARDARQAKRRGGRGAAADDSKEEKNADGRSDDEEEAIAVVAAAGIAHAEPASSSDDSDSSSSGDDDEEGDGAAATAHRTSSGRGNIRCRSI